MIIMNSSVYTKQLNHKLEEAEMCAYVSMLIYYVK